VVAIIMPIEKQYSKKNYSFFSFDWTIWTQW